MKRISKRIAILGVLSMCLFVISESEIEKTIAQASCPERTECILDANNEHARCSLEDAQLPLWDCERNASDTRQIQYDSADATYESCLEDSNDQYDYDAWECEWEPANYFEDCIDEAWDYYLDGNQQCADSREAERNSANNEYDQAYQGCLNDFRDNQGVCDFNREWNLDVCDTLCQ